MGGWGGGETCPLPKLFKTILRFLSSYFLVCLGKIHKMNNSDADIDDNDDDEGDVKPH